MIYRFGKREIDCTGYRLYSVENGLKEAIPIEPQVFDLLRYLVENRDRLITRDELFENLWVGKVISDTTLSGHIKFARKAIGDDGQKQNLIKTVRGRGYQFVGSVLVEDKNISSPAPHLTQQQDISQIDSIVRSKRGPLVAVLPFLNRSSDPEQQYFSEGMSEDITTELSRFSDIQVLARNSAFKYSANSSNTQQYDEPSLDYLVEGSVRRTGDKIRINAQLNDADNNQQLWAEKFDCKLDQVFDVQDKIIESIVSTISGQLKKVEMVRASARATSNLQAYDHLLRGLAFHKNGYTSYENYSKASKEFAKAIELDPHFARARAWKICSKANMWDLRTKEMINEVLEEAKFALSLDASESETHRILGALYMYAREFELSRYHYSEARKLSPNDAHIAVQMGRFLAYTDRLEEALELILHAKLLNPFHPGWYWQELGVVYYSMNEFEEAIKALQKNWGMGAYDLALLAICHVALGEMSQAREYCRKALEKEPRASVTIYTQFENYQDPEKCQLLHDRMIAAGFPE